MSETTSTIDILDKPTNAVKILEQTDSTAIVGGYGVVFDGRDVTGDTFSKDTNYMLDLVPVKPVFYDHGIFNKSLPDSIGISKNESTKVDDIGVWFELELDKSKKYVDAVIKLVERGVLGLSTGTVHHMARAAGKIIKTWPIVEISLTATPAEPRTLGVERIKQLAETNPSLKALIPESGQETASDKATAADVEAADIGDLETETGEIMTEKVEEKAPEQVVDNAPVLDAIKGLAGNVTEQFKAFDARLQELEKEPANPIQPVKNVNVVTDTDHWKYDNYDANDLSLAIEFLNEANRSGMKKSGRYAEAPNIAAYKALAHRLESDEARRDANLVEARKSFKSLGVKANEIAQSTLANYGDEWVGVAYSGQLWEKIRHETFVLNRLPQFEAPAGAESVVFPLEGGDPVWYKVNQAASLTSNPGGIPTNTVTASTLGTDNNSINLVKMGARVLWTGEMDEDSVLPYVPQLRQQLVTSGAEYLEHVLIDGDTATGGSTNINDIAGTPAGTEAFLLVNGFRKSPLVTTTANSRDGGALAIEDFKETVMLMGLAGRNAMDKSKVSFIIDPWVHWKALELTELKTRDVYSAPTIENGTLMNIYGYDVNTSLHMHKANQDATYGYKSNTAGKLDLDTASNNTKGVILAVRWDQWRFAWRRRMTLETTRVPAADSTEIVAMMRFGFQQRDTEGAAISYNLTVA